ncbi:hypothetical protein [Novosphingobium sp. Gsoil 351]|uniref:hypothetical protein n=1 Tax=Novosphingobium sp. Gsoil 351 TaxID=2675225 RepID=UPI0012B4F55C|nr:hypothetical protein [Novosphingobium sp. Gsoil 351]QGN55909.1 hypothetical protein GKE62_16460 [Novosphingobium sp. Gsoil 351]
MTDLSKAEVLKALAAAEFAAAFALPLDTMVTLDFGRMNLSEPSEARDELQRFVKTANAWLYDRGLPTASIAVVERSMGGNMHAHLAMHVPGMRRDEGRLLGIRHRSHFRAWASEYTDRRLGKHVPRAVNIRGSLCPSILRHWISVSYLLKSHDRDAVLVGARNRPDRETLWLSDILAFDYVNPGAVGPERRLFISSNLGPARRAIGTPPAAEFLLDRQPHLANLALSLTDACTAPDAPSGLPRPRPFRAAVEDGVFDVRRLYGSQFASFVTGLGRPAKAPDIRESFPKLSLLERLDLLGV